MQGNKPMSMRERNKNIREIQLKHDNLGFQPLAIGLLRIATPFIRRFRVSTKFEDSPPIDGGVIFAINHQNFFDSLVNWRPLDRWRYVGLAGDEPRGSIQGLSFEARGNVWINRSDPDSRKASVETLLALLRKNMYVGWSPEGTWNTTENRLMLPLAHGMGKVAIQAAQTGKVYIVPVMIDYEYKKDSYRVKRASVRVCKAIPVKPDMDAVDLTEQVETVCWTTRWEQIEAQMQKNPDCIKVGGDYVYPRAKLSRERWKRFVDKLHSQYKVDWNIEESYRVVTKEERLQQEMQKYINPRRARDE